jgi:hypothetical protein
MNSFFIIGDCFSKVKTFPETYRPKGKKVRAAA